MATRMQQRRGTAAQWTAANPVLAAGEIGFETDTSKFKMGNGSSNWGALTYFANAAELAAIVDGAPDLLNTLNELAAAIGDDPAFYTTLGQNLQTHINDSTQIHGIADTAQLATLSNVGIAASDAAAALSAHNSDTTFVHGIADTSILATTGDVSTAASDAAAALSAHNSDTTIVHGIADTSLLATTGDVATASSDAAAALLAHGELTENVHGILNTENLATTSFVTDAIAGAEVDQSSLAGTGIDWNSVDGRFDIDSTVATKTYADNAVSTHDSDTTNVHGIVNTALLATTADVAAVTKTTLGLGNVDNTSDADKPVSTATVTAIATAKSEAIAEVTAVIDGAPNALNTLNELAAALGDDANFASTVTTSLATKVDSYTPITQKTASYTLSTLDHRDDLIEMGSASALTLTIPLNSSIAYPVGTSLDILQTGAGQVTIAGAAGVTVNATPGLKLRTQWSSATLFKRAENTWVVYGDLTA